MTKEEYLAQRQTIVDEAQACITGGKLEDAAAKTQAIKDLDAKFEAEGKVQANLNALSGTPKIVDIAGAGVPVTGKVVETTLTAADPVDIHDSIEYRKAFANYVVNKAPIPQKFLDADANTVSTDVGTVIPTTIMQRIVEKWNPLV